MGLEEALLNTKATDEVESDIVCNVWNLVQQADREVYKRLLSDESMALEPLLNFLVYRDPAKNCNIITTNYDRIIECSSQCCAVHQHLSSSY